MTDPKASAPAAGYQLFMLALCLFALAQLAFQATVQVEPGTRSIMEGADFLVCLIFLADFTINLVRSPNRLRYLVTWGWVDLLSSIPSVDVVRWGRLARVFRVFRVLRAVRATRELSVLILRRRTENTFLAVSLVALLVLFSCSIAILHVETDPMSNIKTGEDAIWWALTTMTTVGYGDRYPVTTEGRAVAAVLMAAGVGLFGTFSGFLAAWLIGPGQQVETSSLDALKLEIAALRATLERAERAADATDTASPKRE